MYSPPPAGPPTHGYPPPGSAYPAGYAVQGYPPPTAYPHGAYVYPPPPQGYGYPPPGYGYPPPAHPAEGQPCYGAPPAGYPPAAPGYAYVVPAPVYGAPPALMDSRAASPRRHLVSRSRSRSRSRGARQRGNNQNNHGGRRRRRGRSVEKGNVNGGGSYGDAESNLTLEEVLPKATTYAMQQEGSRFLQTVMGGENLEDRQKVMEALLPEVAKLSKDAFGNFIVQKMLENADAWDHQSDLVKRLEGEVLNLASDKFGCRVIQKAMEVLPHEHQETLAGELKTNVQECIENMNGNHVVQKCVQCMRSEAVDFIVQAVQSRIAEISMHSFGCRVVQRLLESCSSSQLERVLDRLTACVSKLARDNHGNYVVQSALDHGRPADKAKIIAAIRRDIVGFGKNKCSSNVVEKCIKVAAAGGSPELEQEYRGLVVALLGDESSSGGGALKDLVHDKFGNYTVQCMIKHSEGPDRDLLRRRIEGMASELRSSTTGKHILSTMKKEFGPSFEGDD